MYEFMRYFCILMLSLGISSDESNKPPHSEATHWGYPEDNNWPQTCQGLKQSPVAITDNSVEKIAQPYPAIKVINYENNVTATCLNDGHTVKITINPEHELFVIGGGLRGKYTLSQIHFHWTSEHTIDGKKIPLEGHFVHINSDSTKYRYKRSIDISENSDVQVLAVMYKISLDDNKELNNIIDSVQHITTVGSTKNIEFVPRSLLPDDMSHYYRYEGSLTTPPCYEIVQWTIFANMVPLSLQQYETIRDVESYGGGHKKNFRQVMPINDRVIKFYNTANAKTISRAICLVALYPVTYLL